MDQNPNPSNALIDRSRIRGASRMIAQGTETKDVTPAQIEQVAGDVLMFCDANKITRKELAAAVGWSQGPVSEFLKGTYGGDQAKMAIDLEDWLVSEEQRRANKQDTQFVWTNVARQIQAVAMYCLDLGKVGMVYGPQTSGLGKTTSLQAIYQDLKPRRSALVTFDKCDANPTGVVGKISAALRLSDKGSNAVKMGRIVDYLSGRSHLLLLDQIHNLRGSTDDKAFYYLMDIYEATHSAQLWVGTSDLVAYLTRQQHKTTDEPLAQIRGRLFPCVDLMEAFEQDGGGERLFTVEQIRQMFAKFQLKLTPQAARWMCQLAHQPDSGALRICVQIMEYATHLARARNLQIIDVPLLKEALRCGCTNNRALQMIAKVEHPELMAKTA